MNSINDDVAKYLANGGVGTLGTDVFSDRYPATPVNLVAVLDTTGNQTPSKDVAELRYPSYQVMVRDEDYPAALTKCEQIRALLHVKIGLQLEHYYVMRSHLRFEFQCIGQDGEGRWEFTATFDAEVQ